MKNAHRYLFGVIEYRKRLLRHLIPVLALIVTAGSVRAQEAGFGRFGRDNDDGLLTLNVTPNGTTTVETNPLHVEFGDGTGQVSAVKSINPTQKVLALTGGGDGAPTNIHYSLLYPGFSARFGHEMRLRLRDSKGRPVRPDSLPHGWMVRSNASGIPLLILPDPGIAVKAEVKSDTDRAELIVKAEGDLGNVRFVTPFGLVIPPVSEAESDDQRVKRATDFWSGIPVPERERFASALSPDGTHVTITETYRQQPGRNIAPLPPVLAFALQHGYPAKVSAHVHTSDCVTKYGPFAYVQGTTLTYTLPVPPTEERGYVRPAPALDATTRSVQERREALLNSLVGHLGGDWASNAVDLGYAGMTNATMAWAYLTPEKRQSVQSAWKTYLPRAFTLPPYPTETIKPTWHQETEPFTGESYLWTYFIDGPRKRRYDVDWGDTLPLYGLYKYAEYSGDWEFVRQHWSSVKQIYRYLDLGDDWAWMTTVNADHGYSTGTGDPMAATFCGTLACLKMATVMEDRVAREHFALKAARIAVPLVARFGLTDWARKNGLIEPGERIEGFWEKETFTTTTPGKSNPWGVTSILSGDGILPEEFAALLAFDRKGLADYEAEYARVYPHWFEPDFQYPFPTSYEGNSVYVTFPHIYARAVLEESFPDKSEDTLWRWLETAEKNRNNAWVGPNVVAELLSRLAPLTLTEWQPASYDDGIVSADEKRVTLTFTLPPRPTDWNLTATLRPGIRVITVLADGKPVPFAHRQTHLQIAHHTQGKVTIEIVCNRKQ